MLKTVRLLKERNGERPGALLTLPKGMTDELVRDGIATDRLEAPPVAGPKLAAQSLPVYGPVVPQPAHDALKKDYEDLKKDALELDEEHRKLRTEFEALKAAHDALKKENAELNALVETEGKPGPVPKADPKPADGAKAKADKK